MLVLLILKKPMIVFGRRVSSENLNGPFLNLLKDMYCKNSCAIKIGNRRTRFFRCEKGVRQGCPQSPNLFNIYINDIVERLNKANTTPLLLKMDQRSAVCCMLMILLLCHFQRMAYKNAQMS